ncbi:MAG: hypothetical protein JNL50_04875 [Phycisphaerae bacterium]|nr:hypothetical protein [Phycisphaerae bacterium]
MNRKVVITGVGAVTPYGVGSSALWSGLVEGRPTLAPTTRLDATGFPCKLSGEVKDFSARDYVPKHYRKAVKVMARDIEMAVAAAKVAVEDAGLTTRMTLAEGQVGGTTYPSERVGCQIGAGLIAAETDELTAALVTARAAGATLEEPGAGFRLRMWGTAAAPDGTQGAGGMNNLTPLWLLKYLPNMLACHVTIIHGCEGPSNTITCNEASGLLSLGESTRVIERDAADLCFSGGAESKVNCMGLLRLTYAGRLAETGAATDGGTLVRPYDPGSPGTIPGEGAGILLLEEANAAAARGAKAYAQIAGFGAAHSDPAHCYSDGSRDIAPGPDEGLQGAIENALSDAGVSAGEIDAIVPHASGIPAMDAGEAGALRGVFGARLASIPLVTVAPFIGESSAGNGAVLAAVGALCVRHQMIPARLHAGNCPRDLRAHAAPATHAVLRHVLVCSSSFGGQNAAIVLRQVS